MKYSLKYSSDRCLAERYASRVWQDAQSRNLLWQISNCTWQYKTETAPLKIDMFLYLNVTCLREGLLMGSALLLTPACMPTDQTKWGRPCVCDRLYVETCSGWGGNSPAHICASLEILKERLGKGELYYHLDMHRLRVYLIFKLHN